MSDATEDLIMLHGDGPCVLCGHDPSCGSARNAEGEWLCHTDGHSCYHRWTVYRERPVADLHVPFEAVGPTLDSPYDRR